MIRALFELGVPVLGICYGCQLMAHTLGGEVTAAQEDTAREYGKTETFYDTGLQAVQGSAGAGYFLDEPRRLHGKGAGGLRRWCAHTDICPTAAIADEKRGFYGVQFHPEVNHTENGSLMLTQLPVSRSAMQRATGPWATTRTAPSSAIREKVGDGKVLLALSGGVDSSVAAALLAEAVGNQLTCVFVDHGLMRKNEGDEVEAAFSKWDINLIRVNAEDRIPRRSSRVVTDPEDKRKIIGAGVHPYV